MIENSIRKKLINSVQVDLEKVPIDISNATIKSVRLLQRQNLIAVTADDLIYGRVYFTYSLLEHMVELKVNYKIDARIIATDVGYSSKDYPEKIIFTTLVKIYLIKIR